MKPEPEMLVHWRCIREMLQPLGFDVSSSGGFWDRPTMSSPSTMSSPNPRVAMNVSGTPLADGARHTSRQSSTAPSTASTLPASASHTATRNRQDRHGHRCRPGAEPLIPTKTPKWAESIRTSRKQSVSQRNQGLCFLKKTPRKG